MKFRVGDLVRVLTLDEMRNMPEFSNEHKRDGTYILEFDTGPIFNVEAMQNFCSNVFIIDEINGEEYSLRTTEDSDDPFINVGIYVFTDNMLDHAVPPNPFVLSIGE